MNKVEPIRNPKKIAQIKNLLKAKDDPRDYLLFTLGVNFALRIQELLSISLPPSSLLENRCTAETSKVLYGLRQPLAAH